jgi:hypothetical protein
MAQKSYREWSPEQPYLLPPSPSEWLPAGHLAYLTIEMVGQLDLSRIEEEIQSKDRRGERPYSPHIVDARALVTLGAAD